MLLARRRARRVVQLELLEILAVQQLSLLVGHLGKAPFHFIIFSVRVLVRLVHGHRLTTLLGTEWCYA
jgi:hypothetical protein